MLYDKLRETSAQENGGGISTAGLAARRSLLLDDVPDRHTGRDHREHVLLVGHFDVEHIRTVVLDHLFQCRNEVLLLADISSAAAVALGDLNEVRVALFRSEAVTLADCFRIVDRA